MVIIFYCIGLGTIKSQHSTFVVIHLRDRFWKKEEREHLKSEKKLNWYKSAGKTKIKYKSILFVPPTPGGILVKQLIGNKVW